MPAPASILAKTYAPLSRPLFIYVKKSSLRRPGVLGFVRYYIDKADYLATKAGYVAPTAEDTAANKAALKDLVDTPVPAATEPPKAKAP